MAETLNQLWSATIVAELFGQGVRHAVICPGSRSTPLALAFGEARSVRRWSVIDERSAGFFALGIAKATHEPVVLVCTSGTAGAHFFPAVIEAAESRIPLIVLTADRPWELHGFGAPQTINQSNLYGRYVRFAEDLPVPDSSPAVFSHLSALVDRAVSAALGRPAGPVHLNVPFREPLSPPLGSDPVQVHPGARRTASPRLVPDSLSLAFVAEAISATDRGVIVVGPSEAGPDLGEAITRLSARTGYPVLAEAASNVRFGYPDSIAGYDALLRHRPFADAVRPAVVLRFGGGITARGPQEWLDRSGARLFVFSEDGLIADPTHLAERIVIGDPVLALCELSERVDRREPGEYAACWREGERRVQRIFSRGTVLDEPAVARLLVESLPSPANLVLGNSMPIRDIDAFAVDPRDPLRVFANRGVNGIDGVTSTALGIAAASSDPTCLIIGDLSFLHDLSGLLIARRHQIPLTTVVINNDGGGIFEFLAVAEQREYFDELFATPQSVDLEHAAALAGAGYARPTTPDTFKAAVRRAMAGGLHLIEVRTDRRENVGAHRVRFEQVAEALGSGPWR